mgnify:CR=1 FL=1
MPLVTTKQMLLDAQAGNYAVGAFNVENGNGHGGYGSSRGVKISSYHADNTIYS